MFYNFLCEGNPFFDAYTDSDFLGKLIYVSLLVLSVISWSVLIHKAHLASRVKKESISFRKLFFNNQSQPLSIQTLPPSDYPNAFGIIYEVLKGKAIEIFEKNGKDTHAKLLQDRDVALLETHAASTISSLSKFLEKNLYILSTVVTLAPFLGLLGTVYGILTTFAELGTQNQAGSNQAILGGLSLALATTVLGLLCAIPALIGYNYLKNMIHEFDSEMQRFATDVLSTFELQYRTAKE
jgi:biopolymer transport protein TolQ